VSAGLNKFFSGLIVLLFVFSGFTPANATSLTFDSAVTTALANTRTLLATQSSEIKLYIGNYRGSQVVNRASHPEPFNVISDYALGTYLYSEGAPNAFTLNEQHFATNTAKLLDEVLLKADEFRTVGSELNGAVVTDVTTSQPGQGEYLYTQTESYTSIADSWKRTTLHFTINSGALSEISTETMSSSDPTFATHWSSGYSTEKLLFSFDSAVVANSWSNMVSSYKAASFSGDALANYNKVLTLIAKSQTAAAKTGLTMKETQTTRFSEVTYKPAAKTTIYVGQNSARVAKVVDFGTTNDQFKFLGNMIFTSRVAFANGKITYSSKARLWHLVPANGGTIDIFINSANLIRQVNFSGLRNGFTFFPDFRYAYTYAPDAALFKTWSALTASQRKLTGFFSACKNGGNFYPNSATSSVVYSSGSLTCNTNGTGNYVSLNVTGITASVIRPIATKWGFTVNGL